MNGTAVRPGQTVNTGSGQDWTVLDRSPRPAHWWLHRWIDGQWQTAEYHARELRLVADPYRKQAAA